MDAFEGGEVVGAEFGHLDRWRQVQHQLHQQRRHQQRNEAPPDDAIGQLLSVKLCDRAGNHHQQQEGEDARFDCQFGRPQLYLLEGQHARKHGHPAIEQRVYEQPQRHGGSGETGLVGWVGHLSASTSFVDGEAVGGP